MTTNLTRVRIVLVEPAGPLNLGSVARIMKNMGFTQLVLVNPQCDPKDAEASKMAVHAHDLLTNAQQVTTLPAALVGCQRVIATIGRDRAFPISLEPPRQALPWLLEVPNSAIVFGREDHGLANEELKYAQRLVQIPANPEYASLNLAQAVAICCYELAVAAASWQMQPAIAALDSLQVTETQLAPFEAVEAYFQKLETILLEIGYLYPHTAASRMEKFRRLLNKASPTEVEVALLRGILRQVEWALARHSPRS